MLAAIFSLLSFSFLFSLLSSLCPRSRDEATRGPNRGRYGVEKGRPLWLGPLAASFGDLWRPLWVCLLSSLFSLLSALFPLLSLLLVSQIALRTCHFELCIRPSNPLPTTSTLCGPIPGPAECAKRLNPPPPACQERSSVSDQRRTSSFSN